MKYKLENSSINDIELIKQYKLKSIFDYADNISEEEDLKIRKYIDTTITIMNIKKVGNKKLLIKRKKGNYENF